MKNFKLNIQAISESKGVKQTVLVTVGNYISAFISALAIIIISRSLGPSLFGEFSAAISLGIILAKINDAGLTIATQKFASQSINKKETKAIIYYGYKLKLLISVPIILITLPLSSYLTLLFNFSNPFLAPVGIVLGLLIVYYDQLIVTMLATHSFFKSSFVNLSQAFFKLASSLIIVLLYPKALFAFFITFSLAPGIPVLFKRFFEPKWFRIIKKSKITKKNKIEILNLAKHSSLLVFVLGVIDSMGILFAKGLLSSYETGLLAGITKIAMLFILIGISLSQVLSNRVSRYSEKSDLDSYLKKTFILSIATIIFYIITIPFLPLIIKFTIGIEYLAALKPLIILLGSVFIYILTVPFTALFYSFNKNSYFSISGLLQLIALVTTNIVFVPILGILGSALAQLVSRSLLLIFTVIFSYKTYKERY